MLKIMLRRYASFFFAAAAASAPTAPCLAQTASSAWHNPRLAYDVNDDGYITSLDVVVLYNWINYHGSGHLPAVKPPDAPYVDTNGDSNVTPLDVLLIINYINAGGA